MEIFTYAGFVALMQVIGIDLVLAGDNAIVIGLVALPYIDRSDYIRPRHRKVAVTAFTAFMVVWIVLTIIGFAFRGPNWGWVWPWDEWHGEL